MLYQYHWIYITFKLNNIEGFTIQRNVDSNGWGIVEGFNVEIVVLKKNSFKDGDNRKSMMAIYLNKGAYGTIGGNI